MICYLNFLRLVCSESSLFSMSTSPLARVHRLPFKDFPAAPHGLITRLISPPLDVPITWQSIVEPIHSSYYGSPALLSTRLLQAIYPQSWAHQSILTETMPPSLRGPR
jgi:hypothetical protein